MNSLLLPVAVTTVSWFLGLANYICSNCKSCQGNKCVECIDGYFLQDKACIQCPLTCSTCNNSQECYNCQYNYWNVQKLCISCPSNCLSGCNIDTGYCSTCPTNRFYGHDCSQDCSLCKDNLCGQFSCTNGCKDGYFQDSYADGTTCRTCSANCAKCSNYTTCTECQASHYLHKYYINTEERTDCLQCGMIPKCEKCLNADVCLSCQNLSNCRQCRINGTSYKCSLCEDGYSIVEGQCVATSVCPTVCVNGCNTNGICVNECQDGVSGLSCELPCDTFCRSCSKTNASFCKACNDDRYTRNCGLQCNDNCLREEGHVICDIDNGSCINGCKQNTWGTSCQKECNSNCQKHSDPSIRVCSKDDGNCLLGCLPGYTGLTCETRVPFISLSTDSTHEISTNTVVRTSAGAQMMPKTDSSAVAVGAGVGGGVVVIVAVTAGIIFIITKRRRKGTDSSTNSHEEVHMTSIIDSLYAQSNKRDTTSTQDYIYSKPNKQKKHQSQNSKSTDKQTDHGYNNTTVETSEPQANVYAAIALDIESEVGDESNTEETITLEDVDDGVAVAVQDAFDMPTSDTYYNTEGLLRSRVQVSDLMEYVRNKKKIEAEFENLPQGLTRTCKEALKPSNREKNRYNGIYAYDATRVVLQSKEYINACYIEVHNASSSYIASLGPTKRAMPQFAVFWEMIWQENTSKIIMLTNFVESEKMKCDQYWPDEGSMRKYGHVSVTTKSEKIYAEFVVRELQIAKTGGSRIVTQYHYTAWPDKSVPDTVASLVEFRDIVEKDKKTSTGPIVVHCSAGIGRTGTYIALDMLIKQGKEENSVDIFGCIMALRGQRVNMVQNVEQYIYLHHCVVYAMRFNPEIMHAAQLTQTMTDSKIHEQYQNYSNLPALSEKEISAVNTNKKRKENRKGADIPGDCHRVKLKMKKDYINAVYVDGYTCPNQFIAAQTPMPSNVDDFVLMLQQENVVQIVCLDKENATDKTIAKYIPAVNQSAKFGQFQLFVVRSETHSAFSFNELKLGRAGSAQSDERIIKHYQVKGWAMGEELPTSVTAFLQLVTAVKKSNVVSVGPIVVHCLDGARNCGLFCAVANMLDKLSVDKQLSIINTICQVRARRRSALQNFDQFKFCYRCVKEYLETAESKTYYNIL